MNVSSLCMRDFCHLCLICFPASGSTLSKVVEDLSLSPCLDVRRCYTVLRCYDVTVYRNIRVVLECTFYFLRALIGIRNAFSKERTRVDNALSVA